MTRPEMFPPFEPDVRNHVMEIIRDDGVNRHIRFRKPETVCMHFDLITWPGHLCYTGDMGSYLFTRLTDMFEFFRCDRPNPSYWSEKVLASDKTDGIKQWSEEVFRSTIKENFEERTEDWDSIRRSTLWDEIKDDIFSECDNGEALARAALNDFNFDGFCFSDSWEWSFSEWSHRFLWCCHAIPFGIAMYDEAKAKIDDPRLSDVVLRSIRAKTKRQRCSVIISTNDCNIDRRISSPIWAALDPNREILESISLPQPLPSHPAQ